MDFQTGLGSSPQSQIVQYWFHTEILDFISSSDWAPSSPDLNPPGFSIWGILEARVNAVKQRGVDSLKKHLRSEWRNLSMNQNCTSIASLRRRLKVVVK